MHFVSDLMHEVLFSIKSIVEKLLSFTFWLLGGCCMRYPSHGQTFLKKNHLNKAKYANAIPLLFYSLESIATVKPKVPEVSATLLAAS